MVPEADARLLLLKEVNVIVGAGGPPSAPERHRLTRLAKVLAVSPTSERTLGTDATA
jgi:hypothetical protein